jgi:hypothetical protein
MHPKKIQSMTNINLLDFSAAGSLLQGGFQIKGIQTQQANLSVCIALTGMIY